jgi:hypothetical protein
VAYPDFVVAMNAFINRGPVRPGGHHPDRRDIASGPTLTSVAGIGDEALTFNQAGNAAQLYVRKGSTGFLLLLGGQYVDSLTRLRLANEEVLATAVLGRL